ncbi:SMI1/KNR4 family protein [Enterovibrio norvegicus]|uniref:SMI1/KNR4 family protein n=1 Tax=Enterovibrio norvegicus TaxID=188144 RepID=UPI000C833421|nr:SMI1/KNR4 family protein [Enterovibrio norvegicus]PML82132.1 hypothetical protein BCT69_01970 [Enterovibrio norvegicus]
MRIPSMYKRLADYPDFVEILGWPFDFEICEPYHLSKEWPILISEELIVLAEDGSGGAYAILSNIDPEESSVIFLSSEGQAGKVAANFTEFLAVLTVIPFWRDLLKFSAGGELEEMRKALPYLKEELLEDEPEISQKQLFISKTLNLPIISDPIQVLFESVKEGAGIEIKANDGYCYESLFNAFSVSDNRTWQIQSGKA